MPPATAAPAVATPGERSTVVYRCDDDVRFVVQLDPEKAWVHLDGKVLELVRVPAASGSRYREADVSYWSKGPAALLSLPEREVTGCVARPREAAWEEARLRGVEFRACGHRPEWTLELGEKESRFAEVAGKLSLVLPPLSATTNRPQVGVAAGHRLVLEIEPQRCVDGMTGEVFPNRVELILDGRRYAGCGRPLR